MKKILFFAITVLFAACGLSPYDAAENVEELENSGSSKNKIEENAALFEQDAEESFYVFELNDERYITENGYTFWTVKNINEKINFEPVCATLSKQSGKAESGFGIVFLSQKIDGKDFLLTVMINTKGQYVIGKYMDGQFTLISDWKTSDYLQRGYGVKNKVQVNYDGEAFILSLNGFEVSTFTVGESLTFWRSKSGYVAVISPYENFPATSVKVTFEE